MGEAKKKKKSGRKERRDSVARYVPVRLAWVVGWEKFEEPWRTHGDYMDATSTPNAPNDEFDWHWVELADEDDDGGVVAAYSSLKPGEVILLSDDPFSGFAVADRSDFAGYERVPLFRGLLAMPCGPEREISIDEENWELFEADGSKVEDPLGSLKDHAIRVGDALLPVGFSLALNMAALIRGMEPNDGQAQILMKHLLARAGAVREIAFADAAAAADYEAFVAIGNAPEMLVEDDEDGEETLEYALSMAKEMVMDFHDRVPSTPGAHLYCELTGDTLGLWTPWVLDQDKEAWSEYEKFMRDAMVEAPAGFGSDAARATADLGVPLVRAMIEEKVKPWIAERAIAIRKFGEMTLTLAEEDDARFFVVEAEDDYEIVTWSKSDEPVEGVDRDTPVYPDEALDFGGLLEDLEEAFSKGDFEEWDELVEVLQDGAREDRVRAMRLLEQVAPHAPAARLNFGLALLLGDVVDRDVRRGLAMLHEVLPELADPFKVMAHGWLAEFYTGKLVPGDIAYDPEKGLGHRIAGAELGDPDSGYSAGLMLDLGLGVPKDSKRAEHFYRRAIAGGVHQAMTNLAVMIMGGLVEGDLEEARTLLETAREMGDPKGEIGLAVMERFTVDGVIDVDGLRAFTADGHRVRAERVTDEEGDIQAMEPFVPANMARPTAIAESLVHFFGVAEDYARNTVGMIYGYSGWSAMHMAVRNRKPSPLDADSPPETVDFRHRHQTRIIEERLTVASPAPEVVRANLDPTGSKRPTLSGLIQY